MTSRLTRSKRPLSAFRLIEFLVVIGILAVRLAIAIPFAGRFQQSQNTQNYAEGMLTALRSAQAKSIHAEQGSAWSVYFNSVAHSYTIYKGTNYDTRDTHYDRKTTLPSDYFFSTGLTDVHFQKVTGAPLVGNCGSVTLTENNTGMHGSVWVTHGLVTLENPTFGTTYLNVTSSKNPSMAGDTVTFTATSDSCIQPGSQAQFDIAVPGYGSFHLGIVPFDGNGQASVTQRLNIPGTFSLTVSAQSTPSPP